MTSANLEGRTAIVTGAGRGIGRAIALRYSRAGAAVAVAARSEDQIEAVAAQINAIGGQALPVRCDVTSESDVARLVEAAIEQFGRIDVLVNNAGVNIPPIDSVHVDPADWRKIIEVNLTGAFLCARAALPHMIDRRSGAILNISSSGGRLGAAGRGPYRASKAALINFTETLAAEVSTKGIRVVCLCPGGVDTDMMREIGMGRGRKLMTPDQFAEVAAYVVSDQAAVLNGAAIDVPGPANTLLG